MDGIQLKRARMSISTVFFINGTGLGTWAVLIPSVQNQMQLSDGVLGMALMMMAIGALVSLLLAGWLVQRLGSRLTTQIAALIFCAALPLPVFAPSLPWLFAALISLGFTNGMLDVSMNVQAVAAENAYKRSILSSFHALFSLGGLVGAGVGGILFSYDVASTTFVTGVSISLFVVNAIVLSQLLPSEANERSETPKLAFPTGPLVGLSILGFVGQLGEGAMADWSAVYLQNVLNTDASLAAAGFSAFSLMMVAGRFTGDYMTSRWGPVTVLRVSSAIASVGLGLGILVGHPIFAILGFGCVGFGMANTIPILFGAAGKMSTMSPSMGIASVATVSYFGFLAGPPAIGFLAELFSLPVTLGMLAVGLATIGIFAQSALVKVVPQMQSA